MSIQERVMSLLKGKPMDEMTRREQSSAYKLLAPTLLIIFLVAIYPLGSAFLKSFTNEKFASDEPSQFVGMGNYRQLLGMTLMQLPPKLDKDTGQVQRDPDTRAILYESPIKVLPRQPVRYKEVSQFNVLGTHYVLGARDPNFILAIKDTIVFTIWTVVLETILGLGFAFIVNAEFPGRGFMRALMLIPWAIPTSVSSRAWQWMFQSTRAGFFNSMGDWTGLGGGQTAFLQIPAWQMPAMIAIDVWKTTPFMALLILAGLQLIPKDVYEAADVDGAGPLRQFWTITLPMLRPTIAVALVFRTLDALRVFDLFQIVLGQSRYSMGSFIYYELINNRATGYSSAGGAIMFVMIFAFAFTYIRTLGVQAEGD